MISTTDLAAGPSPSAPARPRIRYLADTHLGHENIIRLCQRPFGSVREMNDILLMAMWEAEDAGAALYHLGDLAFKPDRTLAEYPGLQHPQRHTLIAGNHDRVVRGADRTRAAYDQWFGRIIGSEDSWARNILLIEDELDDQPLRLLLSHAPQRDLRGAVYNLYGHCHNNNARNRDRFAAEYPWLVGSARHFNVSVELHGYRPVSLEELVARRAAGEELL